MDSRHKDFLLSEYAALRKETEALQKHLSLTENIALLFTGGLWAWLLTDTEQAFETHLVYYLPLFISILFGLRWISVARSLSMIGRYVRILEEHLDLPKDLGWEKHLSKNRSYWLIAYHLIFFASLILGNLIIPAFL